MDGWMEEGDVKHAQCAFFFLEKTKKLDKMDGRQLCEESSEI